MNNQVSALQNAGIPVATLNSNTPPSEKKAILDDLRCGHPRTRLLYVTPEYCILESFRRDLHTIYTQGELSRIAIDEAHCISEWGHDFRTAYKRLDYFRASYPLTPIICLTATATQRVRNDIITTLSLYHYRLKIFTVSASRPNLHYEVRFYSLASDDIRFDDFVTWLRSVHSRRAANISRRSEIAAKGERPDAVSGIIYTTSREECNQLSKRLRNANIGAAAYHAGMTASDRIECQRRWLENEPGYDVVVATTAFGMGIDKENVRFVVHWCIPKSFEGYYQEAGRAGRDGKAAFCMLYYSREDRDIAAHRIAKDAGNAHTATNHQARAQSFEKLVKYCESTDECRHKAINGYFEGDEDAAVCDFACDWCKDRIGLKRRKEETLASEEWLSTQKQMQKQKEAAYYDEYDYDI